MTNQLIYVDDTTNGICGNAGVTIDNGALINNNNFECYGDLSVGSLGTIIHENGNVNIKGSTELQETSIFEDVRFYKSIGRPVTGYGNTHGEVIISGEYVYVSGGTDGVASLVFKLSDSYPGNDIYFQCNNIDSYYMYVTPDNFFDGHTLEFTSDNQYAHLIWTDSHWKVFEHSCQVKQNA